MPNLNASQRDVAGFFSRGIKVGPKASTAYTSTVAQTLFTITGGKVFVRLLMATVSTIHESNTCNIKTATVYSKAVRFTPGPSNSPPPTSNRWQAGRVFIPGRPSPPKPTGAGARPSPRLPNSPKASGTSSSRTQAPRGSGGIGKR